MANSIAGVSISGSRLGREVTEPIEDSEPRFSFITRVGCICFGALAGLRRKLRFDPELLYVGAMFHDIGLISPYSSTTETVRKSTAPTRRESFCSSTRSRVRRLTCNVHTKSFLAGEIRGWLRLISNNMVQTSYGFRSAIAPPPAPPSNPSPFTALARWDRYARS